MKKTRHKSVAKRIAAGMAELEAAMAGGKAPEQLFTVKTVEVAEPAVYDASQVRALRLRLNVSQAVFARLVGVSAELVEHWEQGVCQPRGPVRRLLDTIAHDPASFLRRNIQHAA